MQINDFFCHMFQYKSRRLTPVVPISHSQFLICLDDTNHIYPGHNKSSTFSVLFYPLAPPIYAWTYLLLTSFTSLFCFDFCVSLIYTIIVHTRCETLDSSIHSVVYTPGKDSFPRLVSLFLSRHSLG